MRAESAINLAIPKGQAKHKKSLRSRIPLIAGGALLLVVIVAVVLGIKSFLSTNDAPKKPRLQEISLVRPPEPPPPPPKPPEEKPPEIKEEVKLNEPPPPQADAPPAGNDLGVDAKGNGSGDGFGLVGRPGGRDITLGGGNSSRFSGYLSGLQHGIREELNRDEKLRKSEYKVIVAIWLSKLGSVDRFELVSSSGDADIDKAMRLALGNMKSFKEPPGDMPQPIKLRVSSR